MTSTGPSEDEETDHAFVYCASCDSKAATSWTFCRSCHSSLDDARPPEDGLKLERDEPLDLDEYGCPKCGHEEANVDDIATTGAGLTMLLDLQTRRFQAVSCANCGYTEFYRGRDADFILDLFFGG